MPSLLSLHAAGQPVPNLHGSPTLAEDDLAPPRAVCSWCGSASATVLDTIQDAPRVDWLECGGCAAISASRMPKQELLDAFYANYYGAVADTAKRITFQNSDRFGRHIGRLLRDRPGTHRRPIILDFGGGDGSLAVSLCRYLLGSGAIDAAEVHVVDYNTRRPADVPAGCEVTLGHELDQVADASYDIVLASAVLEHIPESKPVLAKLAKKLNPNGVLYARTPYALPMRQLTRRLGASYPTMYPAHVHDLGQPFWERIHERIPTLAVVTSRPSIVETTFGESFLRTLAATAFKAPWRVLGKRWKWVGGWEVVLARADRGRESP